MVSTTTTGTGDYSLGSAVVSGHPTLQSTLSMGDTVYYTAVMVDASGNPAAGGWEVGFGTFNSSGNLLARTRVISSSNSNAAVSWGAGTKYIALSRPAALDKLPLEFVIVGPAAGFPTSSGTITVPEGARFVTMEGVCPGGGGGAGRVGAASTVRVGGNGGNGGHIAGPVTYKLSDLGLSAGSTISYNVGGPGAGAASAGSSAANGGNGGDGGNIQFYNGSVYYLQGTGGYGGVGGQTTGAGNDNISPPAYFGHQIGGIGMKAATSTAAVPYAAGPFAASGGGAGLSRNASNADFSNDGIGGIYGRNVMAGGTTDVPSPTNQAVGGTGGRGGTTAGANGGVGSDYGGGGGGGGYNTTGSAGGAGGAGGKGMLRAVFF
jgi:hypothetical protein